MIAREQCPDFIRYGRRLVRLKSCEFLIVNFRGSSSRSTCFRNRKTPSQVQNSRRLLLAAGEEIASCTAKAFALTGTLWLGFSVRPG